MVKTQIGLVRADQLDAQKHQVFDVEKQEFIDILHVIKTGPTNKIMKISKNLIEDNVPNNDLYITTGHRIMYHGQPVKVRDIPGAIYIGTLMPVYTLVCENSCAVDINGAPVMVFNINEWNKINNKQINDLTDM